MWATLFMLSKLLWSGGGTLGRQFNLRVQLHELAATVYIHSSIHFIIPFHIPVQRLETHPISDSALFYFFTPSCKHWGISSPTLSLVYLNPLLFIGAWEQDHYKQTSSLFLESAANMANNGVKYFMPSERCKHNFVHALSIDQDLHSFVPTPSPSPIFDFLQ